MNQLAKICTKCNKPKDIVQFSVTGKYRRSECKACQANNNKLYRAHISDNLTISFKNETLTGSELKHKLSLSRVKALKEHKLQKLQNKLDKLLFERSRFSAKRFKNPEHRELEETILTNNITYAEMQKNDLQLEIGRIIIELNLKADN